MTCIFGDFLLLAALFQPLLPNKQNSILFFGAVKTTLQAYVAIWIEDSERKPVKTIQLWVGKDGG